MALTIRKGATKVYIIGLDGCTSEDYLWSTFDKTLVRLQQGNYVVEKELHIMEDDATAGLVHFTEADTLPLVGDSKALLQVASLKETSDHELVLKSREFEVVVLPSLWTTPIASGIERENLVLLEPDIPKAALHSVYETLHIDIKEYSGIISERADAIIEGQYLVFDPQTETLYSSDEVQAEPIEEG